MPMVRPMTETTQPDSPPLTFKLESMPDWGVGLLLRDTPPHVILFFEHAGEKKFVKEKATSLVPVVLEAEALAALRARASGRKPRAAPRPSAAHRPAARKPAAKRVSAPRFATVGEQVALFEKLFPGGFTGEAFTGGERQSKQAATELAQQTLSKEAFASATTDELFERARAVLGATNIVFPIEGPIPFRQLEGEDRAKAVAGLKELLHGEGPLGERLEGFTASLNLKDSAGAAKKVTWPLATVFAGLFAPAEHTCVKPTAFAGQAATLGLAVEKTQPVNAAGYGLFLDVATRTRAALLEAGHQPRDLLDVYTFIWRTHAEKPAP